METPKADQQTEYTQYADACLEMVELAPDQKSRMVLREMAAEWLKLVSDFPR